MKKLLSIVLTAVLAAGCLLMTPISASAAEKEAACDKTAGAFYAYGSDVIVDNVYDEASNIVEGTLEITYCDADGNDKAVRVPSETVIYANGGTDAVESAAMYIYSDAGCFDFGGVSDMQVYIDPYDPEAAEYEFTNNSSAEVWYTWGMDFSAYKFTAEKTHPMMPVYFDFTLGGKVESPYYEGYEDELIEARVEAGKNIQSGLADYFGDEYADMLLNPFATANGVTFEGWYSGETESCLGSDTTAQASMAEEYYLPNYYTGEAYYYGKGIVFYADWSENAEPADYAEALFSSSSNKRIYGSGRYETAMDSATELRNALGGEKLDVVIAAYGDNYPDALAGGYLADICNAPVLLVNSSKESTVKQFIKDNVNPGGRVYILGGTGVVSEKFENSLGLFEVKRLAGENRYETNYEILIEAKVTDEDLLICTGNAYADSLSASSAGLPVLLVGSSMNDLQEYFLETRDYDKEITIVGGTGAVSEAVESKAAYYTDYKTARLNGADRYETSRLIAEKYFGNSCSSITLAYGNNYPDGLSGGSLAALIDAPVLLVMDEYYANAKAYADKVNAENAAIFGGPALISDKTVNKIMK